MADSTLLSNFPCLPPIQSIPDEVFRLIEKLKTLDQSESFGSSMQILICFAKLVSGLGAYFANTGIHLFSLRLIKCRTFLAYLVEFCFTKANALLPALSLRHSDDDDCFRIGNSV